MAIGGFTGSNAEAEVDYVNASVDVFLDYDSKNREFYFTVSLAEAHEFAIVKPGLSDVFAVLDVAAVQSGKSPSHSVTVSDTASKVLAKAIADGFALDDSALIDKDYVGTKGNVTTVLDILRLSYEHPVADSCSMSDVVEQAWGWVRTFNDSLTLTDSESNPLGTFILNTSIMNPSDSQFMLTKGNDQVDVLGIADTTALTPGKNFTNTFTFSETDSYSLGKGLSDTFGCTDVLYIDFKTLADSLSLSDILSNHPFKNSSDTATVSDTINLSLFTGGIMNVMPLNTMRLN